MTRCSAMARLMAGALFAGMLVGAGAGGADAPLPMLKAGPDLRPGWAENVRLVDDLAAPDGKALALDLTPEVGKATSAAYWNGSANGLLARGPQVQLMPGHRYRAWVRLRVRPNRGSSSAIVLYMSTTGQPYNPAVTWRPVQRYYGFQFAAADTYEEKSVEFTTGEAGIVIPEIRVINMGPEPDGHHMGPGDLEAVALAGIRFQDVTPPVSLVRVRSDKGHYRRADAKTAEVVVRNHSDSPRQVRLDVSLHRDIDEQKVLFSKGIELAAGETRRYDLRIPARDEFGYELRAGLHEGETPLDSAGEVFTIADNVYKIQMWTSAGPTNAPAFCWSGAVNMTHVPELVEGLRAGNCNFYEFFAWPPDDGLDFVPKGERWWAGQNGYPESRENLRGIIEELHKHGIRAVMYAAWWSNGTGIETFRRHPDWFLYDAETGRGGGCDIESYKQAKALIAEGKEGVGVQKGGGGAAPNWADPRVVTAGLDSMRESIRLFGWDGVRWDGEYQMTYYWDMMDIQGRKVKELYQDLDATNTRILRQIVERFRPEEPAFVWGYNNEVNPRLWGDRPPAAVAYKLKQGGSLMWESPREANTANNPNHTFAEYSRNTREMADYCRARGGYFMQFPAGAGWVGTVHDRLYKTIIPVAAGSTVYGNSAFLASSVGEYNRFIARYCALWWGDDVRSVPEPRCRLEVTGSRPIWWQDYVDARPAGWRTRDLIVHLVNEPVNQTIGPDVTGEMPPVQQDVRIALQRSSGRIAKAWWLTPEPTVRCEPLEIAERDGADTVTVPRLGCWSVAVLRVRGGEW